MSGKHTKKNILAIEDEPKKRYRMWKSKKHWVYGAVLFFGTGAALAIGNVGASAEEVNTTTTTDTTITESVTETPQDETEANGVTTGTTAEETKQDVLPAVDGTETTPAETTTDEGDTPEPAAGTQTPTAGTETPATTPAAEEQTPADVDDQETTQPEAGTTPVDNEQDPADSTASTEGTDNTPAVTDPASETPETLPVENSSGSTDQETGTVTDLNDNFSDWTVSDAANAKGEGTFVAKGEEYEVTLSAPAFTSLTKEQSALHPLMANTIKKSTQDQKHTYAYDSGSGVTSWYYTTNGTRNTWLNSTPEEIAAAKYYTSVDEFGNSKIARVISSGNYQIAEQVQITQDGEIQHIVTILNQGADPVSGLKGMGVHLDTMLDRDDKIPVISDGAGGISIQSTAITLYCTPLADDVVLAGKWLDTTHGYYTAAADTTEGSVLKSGIDTAIMYETPVTTLSSNQSVTFEFAERVLVNSKLTEHYVDANKQTILADKVISGQPGESYDEAPATIPGYTYQSTVGNGTGTFDLTDTEVTYIYQANPAELTITYVDDDNNGATVGDVVKKSGVTNGTGTYDVVIPSNYVLASNQAKTVNYKFAADTATTDNVTIHLKHDHETSEVTTTETIHYTGAGDATPADHTEDVNWTVDTDKVTKDTTYTPEKGYAEVVTPEVAGYTPDKTTVAAVDLTATTTVPTDSPVEVAYTADTKTEELTTTYSVDFSGPEGLDLPEDVVKNIVWQVVTDGATGNIVNTVTSVDGPVAVYIPGYTAEVSVDIPAISEGVTRVTSTVPYEQKIDEDHTAIMPAAAMQFINGTNAVDSDDPNFNRINIQVGSSYYNKVKTSEFDDQSKWQPFSVEYHVVYTADSAYLNVNYVDDDNGESVVVVNTPKTLTGKTAEAGTYTVLTPVNYQLAEGQSDTVNYIFAPDKDTSDDITIHLTHAHDNTQVTTTRTIDYTGAGGKTPADHTQSVTWNVDTDKVTKTSTYTPVDDYAEVSSPEVTGYTPDKATVAAVDLKEATTAPTNSTVEVAYSADEAQLTITYVDDDNNGSTVGTPETKDGTVGETGTYTVSTPENYQLAKGQAASIDYTFTAGTDTSDDLTIHLTHAHATSEVTTTQTVHYTGAGDATPADHTEDVNWTIDTDKVTKDTTYTPEKGYAEVVTPEVAGYTPDKASIAAVELAATSTAPTDSSMDVTYTSDTKTEQLTTTYAVDFSGPEGMDLPADVTKNVQWQVVTDGATGNIVNTVISTDGPVEVYIPGYYVSVSSEVLSAPDGTISAAELVDTNGSGNFRQNINSETTAITPAVALIFDSDSSGYIVGPDSSNFDVTNLVVGASYHNNLMSGLDSDRTAKYQPANIIYHVVYSPQPANLSVSYVDDDTDGAIVGKPEVINGKTAGTGTYIVTTPEHYILATGQADTVDYAFATGVEDTSDNITIHLVHEHATSEVTTTQTVHYAGASTKTPVDKIQTVTWNVDTDKVTKVSTYTPDNGYKEVKTPVINGYTADKATVPAVNLAQTTTAPTNTTVEVAYSADKAALTVTYVDDDNEGSIVGTPETKTGTTDETGAYTVTAPQNYQLAKGQSDTVDYTFEPGEDTSDDITVHLVHAHDNSQVTTTETVHYTGAGTDIPADNTQEITWKVDTDKVTKVSTYTPANDYAEVATPEVTGYTPNQLTVAAVDLTETTTTPTDTTVNVTYSADEATLKVTYVDDDKNGSTVGKPTTLTGATGKTGTYTVVTPENYQLAKGQAETVDYAFATGDDASDDFVIHLTHVHEISELNTTYTFNYTGPKGMDLPEHVVKNITWQVDTDKVNHHIVNTVLSTDGSEEVYIPGYTATVSVDIPAVDEGTTAVPYGSSYYYVNVNEDHPTINPTAVLSWAFMGDDSQNVDSPERATGEFEQWNLQAGDYYFNNYHVKDQDKYQPASIIYSISYTPDEAELKVIYVDDDNDGSTVGKPQTLTGATNETGTYYAVNVPTNFVLAKGQAEAIDYAYATGIDDSDDITIHLVHEHKTGTVTTTQKIHYTGAGAATPADHTQDATWNVDTDKVTKVSTYTPANDYAEVATPEVAGYTPDQKAVAAVDLTATTTVPADSTVKVIYAADKATLTVTYVDDDDNGSVLATPTLNGVTGGTGTYTPTTLTEDYKLADGQATKVDFTFAAGDDTSDDFTVHLVHEHDTSEVTTTEAIHYTGAGTNTPEDHTQSVTWNVDTDKVTKVSTYTPANGYAEVPTPNVAGYTPDQKAVAAVDLTAATTAPKDNKVEVTYTADGQKGAVVFFDDTTGQWLKTDTFNGNSEGVSDYTTAQTITDFEAQGYELVSDSYPTEGVNFDTDDAKAQIYSVHLVHGTTATEETKTVTEDIEYVYEDGTAAAATNEQQVSFTRTVTLDNVTGSTTYSEWTATTATSFIAVESPTIAGYTANQTTVAGSEVTPDSEDLQVQVVYTKNTEPATPATTQPTTTAYTVTPTAYTATPAEPANTEAQTTTAKQGRYPKTGETNSASLSILGISMAALAGLFLGKKKKEEE